MSPFDDAVDVYGHRLLAIASDSGYSTFFAVQGEVDDRHQAAIVAWIRRTYGFKVLVDVTLAELVLLGYVGYSAHAEEDTLIREVLIDVQPFDGAELCTFGEF